MAGDNTPRTLGNALFGAGKHAEAAAAYTFGIDKEQAGGDAELAVLLSNRAACLLELGDMSGAAADCR